MLRGAREDALEAFWTWGDASRIIHQWSDQQDTCSELTIFTTQLTQADPSRGPSTMPMPASAPLCGIALLRPPSSRQNGRDGFRAAMDEG
ncbi:hypothetical protein NPX13_g1025 [Xylaria arbuscula]|uniref:Uncharacterized protein n=1 Tax=Xylaria arbuscula TaxID=114810 RepID=A0A9W8NM78_9PEZI|nr:hypothetical protein NPX13_g1025 [Xylaria arbuscula]